MTSNESIDLPNTLGTKRTVDEVFRPASSLELFQKLPAKMQRYRSVNVISRGNNWGYGCSAPAKSGGLLVDLSLCREIKAFDRFHGTITLEPGVTYSDLANFLAKEGDEWLAPVHGGGGDCSVVGNALERGYGLTPHADHFGAVMSLKAILSSGEIYEGSLTKLGAGHLDKLFKYGIGPYFDGLFSQSGVGIVTEVTLRLARRPEFLEMFYFNLYDEEDLEVAVAAIKKSKRELGSVLGGINLINQERCLSMLIDYPKDKIQLLEPLTADEIHKYSRQYKLSPWLVIGTIHGQRAIAKAAKMQLLKNFTSLRKRAIFFNSGNRKLFFYLSAVCQRLGLVQIARSIQTVDRAFEVLNGQPNNIALRLAYWKNPDAELVKQSNLNPTRDGCGLIWYAPLVEMKSDSVRRYTEFIKAASAKYGFNNLVTLTTVDDLCFDSTVPILFDRSNELDHIRAHEFYRHLLHEGLKLGFFPYRLNIESQREFDFQTRLFKLELVNEGRYR